MLSLEECLDFCGLDSEEIEGIAEHEHLPLIVAAELGYQMLQTTDGIAALQAILLDNIEIARCRGDESRADEYAKIYRHFLSAHAGTPSASSAI